jgi:histidinol dehydrogenase
VSITVGNQFTSYIKSIEIVPKAEPVTFWDFRLDEYTGEKEYKGLEMTGTVKKHGAQYGMAVNNATISVPVAGPSEIAVLTDGSVSPKWIAADLLSQAEHGSGWEKSLCVCTTQKFAEEIKAEVLRQTKTLSRREIIQRVIDKDGILIVVVKSVKEGMAVVNRFAPEHFEIMTKDALEVMKGVRSAGAVFAGAWTPESAGDFVAGPSHVLPTGGAANMFNGLTPDDFRRRHSFVAFTKEDLAETKTTIEKFAEVEGLDAHGRAATIRFE